MREQNSRGAILESALQLFALKGYDAVGVGEIVEAAHITKPTLYYFFGSKEGLFEQLLQDNCGLLQAALSRVQYTPNPDEYLRDVRPTLLWLCHSIFHFAKEHKDFYLMLLSLTFAPPSSRPAQLAMPYLKQMYLGVEGLFTQMSHVHKGLRGRERECAWRLLAMVNAQVGFWHVGYAKLDDKVAESIVAMFMHGIFS